ncbi:MAG: hypothetical protein K2W95_36545 [Candidatus Obscuribacterales bacterium]|nr:hypothetical protein [Candidatus Obscuribacterales bacterium]
MDNNPLPLLASLVGMLLLMSIHARLMHKPARDKCKRVIKNISATGWWWFLKAVFYCAAIPANLYNRIHRSRTVSPQLYLPAEQFSGSMADFLRAVAQYPAYAECTEERLVRLIDRGGIDYRRTFELRYRCRNKRVTVYNVFRNLPLVDCETLSEMVYCLRNKRPGQILTLVGPCPSGKTMTVQALAKLLESAEPVPLVKNEFGLRINPLRLLTVIHAFASRFQDTPRDVAVAEILDEMGFGALLKQKRDNARLQELCKLADVPVTLQGIASLAPSYRFMAILHQLVGLHLRRENYHEVKRFELDILLQVCWMPQDAEVIGVAQEPEHGVAFSYPRERFFDRSTFVGDVNLSQLGRVADNSAAAWSYDGYAHQSNNGMLVVDEALRYSAEIDDLFTGLANSRIELRHDMLMHWDGLLVLVTGPHDVQQLLQDRRRARRLDNLRLIRFTRCMDISALEQHIGEIVNRAIDYADKYGRTLKVDPVVVPMLARLVSVSEIDDSVPATEALDLIDPSRGGVRLNKIPRNQEGGISLRVVQHALQSLLSETRCHEGVTTVTREQVVDALRQMVSRRFISGNDNQLLQALEAIEAWLNQPHPVLHSVHWIKTTWRDRHKLLPRLKQWVAEFETRN